MKAVPMPPSRHHLLGSSAVAGASILTASAGASVLGAPTASCCSATSRSPATSSPSGGRGAPSSA